MLERCDLVYTYHTQNQPLEHVYEHRLSALWITIFCQFILVKTMACEILHCLSGLQDVIIIPESSDMTRDISIVFKVCSEDGSHPYQFILYNFCDLGCHRSANREIYSTTTYCVMCGMFHPRPRSYMHTRPGEHVHALLSFLGWGIHRFPLTTVPWPWAPSHAALLLPPQPCWQQRYVLESSHSLRHSQE